MTTESLRSYNAVIARTLSKAIQLGEQSPKSKTLSRRGIAGFCQLRGPTGGGKSSSLYREGSADNVKPALELVKDANRQVIFVTHRWNILHDIFDGVANAKDSQGKPFTASILYAQYENVIAAATQTPLPHEKGVQSSDLPNPFDEIELLRANNLFVLPDLEQKLSKICSHIAHTSRALNSRHLLFLQGSIAQEKENLRKSCASLERILLKNITALEKGISKIKQPSDAESEATKAVHMRLQKFRENPWIRRIFPAIRWQDEKQHLLIMTTQKLFSSFYDGQNKVRMSHSGLNGHVIFIDEFDYQADVLQQLLAQAQSVQEPPECLGQLLENGRRFLKRNRHNKSEYVQEINHRLETFLDELENELEASNIDLSSARAMTIPLEHYQENRSFSKQFLFRSDHLVTSQSLTMRRAEHGYEVEVGGTQNSETEQSVDVGSFLRLMEKSIREFSLIMSDLSSTEEEAREDILGLSKLLFDPANDYRPSYYGSTLPNLSLFSLPRADEVELEPLIKSNILPNTHANVYGLTNWLLQQNTSEVDLDPLRIQIKRAFLPTTPEGLLLSLSTRNLVFALSATSYMERAIGNFDLRWLTSALRYVAEARTPSVKKSFLGTDFDNRKESWFNKPIPYVQDDTDIELQNEVIASLSKAKTTVRNTNLQLHIRDFEDMQQRHECQEVLESLPPSFFQQNSEPITKATQQYREKVLCMLLEVISLAEKNCKHKGQLAFVNSTKYLREWLLSENSHQSRECLSWLEIDGQFSSKVREESINKFDPTAFDDVFIPVIIHNTPAIICLLTAECQKRHGFRNAYQSAFETDGIVLILTQIASATNGINLDFSLLETGEQMDLTCLYLLEAQHFYFSALDETNNSEDEMAHAGSQLRNLDKLCRAGELSRAEHKINILPLMTNSRQEISLLNERYKRTDDYVKNTAANVQQQVGRIERAWRHIPRVEIHLASDLAQTLVRFTSMPTFCNNRALISDLNIQLLEALLKQQDAEQYDFITQLMTPTQTGDQAVEIIDNRLVPAIREARRCTGDSGGTSGLWHSLGRAVLEHDYAWNPKSSQYGINVALRDWACFEKPVESLANGKIWYDPNTWQFFGSSKEGCIRYNPERFYGHIQRHPAIIDWFNRRGYRTSIQPFANDIEEHYAFHPLVVQRLLQGRLGEEAIRALLYYRGIRTHITLDNPGVLELYDFSVSGSSFRIDAKFWSQDSQNEADLEYQTWQSGGSNLNDAPLGLIQKIAQIRRVEGPNIKLAILNFVATRDDAPLLGFDHNLQPSPVDQADILTLSGCVADSPITTYTPGFQQFTKLIFSDFKNKEASDAIDES